MFDHNEKVPVFTAVMIAGLLGLLVSSSILFFDMGHSSVKIFVTIIVVVIFFMVFLSYFKKCLNPPVSDSRSDIRWNTQSIYIPVTMIFIAVITTLYVLIMCIMYHLNYTFSDLFESLGWPYILRISFVLFSLMLVIVGGLYNTGFHYKKNCYFVQKVSLLPKYNMSEENMPPPVNPEYSHAMKTVYDPLSLMNSN